MSFPKINSYTFSLVGNDSIKNQIDSLVVFLFSFILFSFLIYNVQMDIQDHVRIAIKIALGQSDYPANFLFYFLVNVLTGYSFTISAYYTATSFLLASAVTAKYYLSKSFIYSYNQSICNLGSFSRLSLLSALLLLSFAIPDPYSLFVLNKMYLGRFVPMVWHNSTVLLLFPFAIGLFWKQVRVLDEKQMPSLKDMLAIYLLVLVNVFIKPSFILVYVPVTAFYLLYRIKTTSLKQLLYLYSPIILASGSILIQYYLFYQLQLGSFQRSPSSITFTKPFHELLLWIPLWFLPISLLSSYALPIFSFFFNKKLKLNTAFIYSSLLTLSSLLLFLFVKEDGPRSGHGNFTWQIIITTYLLFLSTVAQITPTLLKRSNNLKDKTLKAVFLLHALAGVIYLTKIIITGSFI